MDLLTPFDNLIRILILKDSVTPIETLVLLFCRVLKIHYQDMLDVSKNFQISTQTFPGEQSIRRRLTYFAFLEQVNRFGRVFSGKYSLKKPPLYNRIYFFRNNVIEHWDDYLEYSFGGSEVSTWKQGTIAIPYLMQARSRLKEEPKVREELSAQFLNAGITVDFADKWYGDYSEVIYTALEKIDSKLREEREDKKTGKRRGIPKTLVEKLYQYSFPVPICDMETYCTDLVAYLSKDLVP
ncbi:hypothetical protein HYV70_05340 [Candidatus Uhrbacteria bacterium]|nr:hypothetical protein [Candidatus Uhrbacteria bacterium]